MATLYILFSEKLNKYYIGSCKDLQKRLESHNNKSFYNAFTINSDDWILYFNCINLDYKQARNIESHIKKMKSKVYIENLIKYPEIIERLKEKYK
jgi:putative endonuclease